MTEIESKRIETSISEKEELQGSLSMDVKQLEQELKVARSNYEKERRKQEDAEKLKTELTIKKDNLKTELMFKTRELEKLEEKVKTQAKEIEAKSRERALLAKDEVSAQEKERDEKSKNAKLTNDQKKLQNKLAGCKKEANDLRETIHQLNKEKENYGLQASQANAKYYQCLE